MDLVPRASLLAGRGLVGNTDQGGRRQITVIDEGMWQQLTDEFVIELDPAVRRANLLISGVPLVDSRDRTLRIGACRVRLLGETRPCERMDEAVLGLRAAMARPWGGGAFGIVLDDGDIAVGDSVCFVD